MYNLKPLGYDKEKKLYKMEGCEGIAYLTDVTIGFMMQTNIMSIIDKSLDGTDGLYNYSYIHNLLKDLDDYYRHLEFRGNKG